MIDNYILYCITEEGGKWQPLHTGILPEVVAIRRGNIVLDFILLQLGFYPWRYTEAPVS